MHLPLRTKVSIALSLLVVLGLSLGLIVSGRIAAHASGGSITLSPAAGPPTTSVTINGTGFGASETVNINFDSTQAGTATTDVTGAFTTPITVPGTAQPGNHNIVATGAPSGTSATAVFNVQTNWSMLGFDAQQDHFNPYENTLTTSNVNQLVSKWMQSTGAGLFSEPVVADGVAYVTTSSAPSTLFALDVNTGTPKWQFRIYDNTYTYSFGTNSVAVDNGVVFVTAGYKVGSQQEGGRLYALDSVHNGNTLWSSTLLAGPPTSPTVVNGFVYVGTVDHGLYQFNESGCGSPPCSPNWTISLGGLSTAPTVVNGLVFIGLSSNREQVIDPGTQKLLWSKAAGGTITAQTVVNNVLYFSTLAQTDLYAYDITTTKLIWEHTASDTNFGYNNLAVANGFVYAGSGNSSATNGLAVFNASGSGCTNMQCTPLWTAWNGSTTGLTVAGGVVYAAFSDNSLQAFNVSGCSTSPCAPLWSHTGSSIYGNGIAVADGIVYVGTVGTTEGTVNAFYVPVDLPSITLSVASGPPTTSLTVSGVHFGANENVIINFDTTQAGTATTDSTGTFTTTTAITVPASTPPGTHTIVSTGQTSKISAQAHFLVQTNWPAFGFDSTRSHFNPYEDTLNTTSVKGLKLNWFVKTLNYVTTSPVFANGYIYVGSADHKLYQINVATRKKITFDTKNPIYSTPAVDSGIVYITTYSTQMYLQARDASSFALKWSATIGNTPAGNLNISSPMVANGIVYVGSNDHNLYAFDAKTGNLLWKGSTGNNIYSSPAVANGMVYVGSNDGNLYAFNIASCGTTGQACQPTWMAPTGGAIVASPTVANGVVYVGSTDSVFYALDATKGTKLWYYTTENEIFSSAAVANGVAYVGSYDHNLYAFNIASCGTTGQVCQPTWMAPTGGYIYSSPAVANGVVYVGSSDHMLYAFDGAGCGSVNTVCSPLKTVSTGGAIKSSPAVANGVVYVGSYDYKLYAFH